MGKMVTVMDNRKYQRMANSKPKVDSGTTVQVSDTTMLNREQMLATKKN
jgi:hypothetical protein